MSTIDYNSLNSNRTTLNINNPGISSTSMISTTSLPTSDTFYNDIFHVSNINTTGASKINPWHTGSTSIPYTGTATTTNPYAGILPDNWPFTTTKGTSLPEQQWNLSGIKYNTSCPDY